MLRNVGNPLRAGSCVDAMSLLIERGSRSLMVEYEGFLVIFYDSRIAPIATETIFDYLSF